MFLAKIHMTNAVGKMSDHPTRNPEIKSTLMPDGYLVLLDVRTDWAHVLNPMGAIAWEFCDGAHSTDDIVNEIATIMEVDSRQNLSQQVDLLLKELRATGLVQ